MGPDPGTIAHHHATLEDGEGANLNVETELRCWIDEGRWVNSHVWIRRRESLSVKTG